MSIERVIVKNYRTLAFTDIRLRPDLNIVVGDNECGKSTLLEAINLALRCQINRRPAGYELHPYLFNRECVTKFVESHKKGIRVPPPEILIELYLAPDLALADLRGTNNSLIEDRPGISLTIRLDDENFKEEYCNYIADPKLLRTVPIEYYEVVWQSFAGHPLDARAIPVRSSMIDPSSISNMYAANKYVLEFTREYLNKKQRVDLALSYRQMRDYFLNEEGVKRINEGLVEKRGVVSDKTLTISMDMTARAGWESGVLPHLDDIPMPLVGKGEQNSIKIKLALEADENCEIALIEEPENHLSHSNLNRLISHLSERGSDKQLIITTHSSFVLNKLGVENILMFNGKKAISLEDLSDTTTEYFKKLPGHDTLRMVLARKTILVEGPSDELIVQKAYFQRYGKMPLEHGVDVISVNALAFKRFLEIAKLLGTETRVVTDNDGNVAGLVEKYKDYSNEKNIRICYSTDEKLNTLEPNLVHASGRELLNKALGKSFTTDEELLSYMTGSKTDCAMKIFECKEKIVFPEYIQNAIE